MTMINGKSFDEMSLTGRSMVVMLVGDLLDAKGVSESYEITINGQCCDLSRLERWIDAMIDNAHVRGRQEGRGLVKETIIASIARLLDEAFLQNEADRHASWLETA